VRLVAARLLIGLVVLICAEVFSGASIQVGMWSPWTWVMTYWLYFAHFLVLCTLAVRTGRTSLGALYLWGVLFGLYESWITKVIWFGYGGDGKLALGSIGPYGYAEISMVLLFHPVASFLLPLAVACVLSPPLRAWFSDVAWLTGSGVAARAAQVYMVLSFSLTMAVNSGGPVHLAENLAFVFVILAVLRQLARTGLAATPAPGLVVLGRVGLSLAAIYLIGLYGLTYRFIRPEGLPSVPIQLVTFVFYVIAALGLWAYEPKVPCDPAPPVSDAEHRRIVGGLAAIVALGVAASFVASEPALMLPIIVNFAVWTPLGFLFTTLAIAGPVFRRRAQSPEPTA
jgi:hypothetical protein